MRGMILAAGRGKRMGALTDHTPKPLLRVEKYYLIEYSLYSLIKIGIKDIVINISYHAAQIKEALGDGSRYGVTLHYSEEPEALETGGGIYQALPLLGQEPFIVLSCDIISDFRLETLPRKPKGLAHLVLVDNPPYHLKGDFSLAGEKIYFANDCPTLTFSNIGIYRPELFAHCQPGAFRLGNLLKEEIAKNNITGEHYRGLWHNVGSPDDFTKITALPDIRL